MAPEGFVTYKEMVASQENVKKDLLDRMEQGGKRVEKLENKVSAVDDKVDHLNDLVLPLTVAMKQTAENTREMSQSLKEFTKNQSETNGYFHTKLSDQALTIENMKHVTDGLTEKKKYNATVVVSIIGLVGIFITGLFQLAPIFFG